MSLPGFVSFEFDLPEALLEQLTAVLGRLEPAALSQEQALKIPDEQGVYQLYGDNELVYIGKTDAKAGLKKRLHRHAKKILGRHGLDSFGFAFKAVQIQVFSAMDLETQLIDHYKKSGKVAWTNSGFGSNDPGRERETTNKNPNGFDNEYPIKLDLPIGFVKLGTKKVSELLVELKDGLHTYCGTKSQESQPGRHIRRALIPTIWTQMS